MRKLILFLFVSNFSFLLNAQDQYIDNLHIRGLKKTNKGFIETLITSHSNGVLDTLQLNKDVIRLKRLPAISHADYQVFYSQENKHNVFINIEENFTLIPNANVWTAINRNFAYRLGLYDYNFLGRGIAFGGFYQNNGYDTYSLNFRAPYLFSKRWGIGFNHQNWRSEEPLYFDNGIANYFYNNRSFETIGLFELNFNHKFQFGVNIFTEKFKYLSGSISDNIPLNFEVDKVLFKFVYDLDFLDYNYQYVNGFRSLLYVQDVLPNSSNPNNFLIAWNDLFYYLRVGEKGNWANRIRLGFSSNDNTPFSPFVLDNNINIRGVGNLIDRGTGVIVVNTEYRYTFLQKGWFAIQGNVFVDGGTWRNPGGGFDDFVKSENIRVYSGLGLRFINTKIFNAILRIDYGYGISENASRGIVFGIGQYF
ncbi:outer membrane protein assembly factor [Gaetbulibacter sp. M240]|uniref:outer membrane protein assembly factor n=1 Tax=Gaetbulibacter sp. M240 TaxID=3126511 RepID=UPI00374F794E